MDLTAFAAPTAGGLLIGCSAALLLLFNGRVAGISGIISGALTSKKNDTLWRTLFILGMLTGGYIASIWIEIPQAFDTDLLLLTIAGLLVGVGTRIGNGCTSGHGICGIGRLSIRSLVATMVFMIVAGLTVYTRTHLL